ncbi:MAG: peroxiredoxin-like family protein [Nitrospinota bacterium]
MKLAEEILEYQKSMMGKIPEETMKIMMGATQRLIESGIAEKSLKVGDNAPDFSLPDATGKTISLSDVVANGPAVLNFYRGAWCPYCNLELHVLQEACPEIENLGARLVAISPNLPDKSLTSIEKHSLKFDVLSDIGNKTAREFGLVYELDEELRPIYMQFGLDIPGHNGDESWELPIPATYLIGTDRKIAYGFVDADYTKRMEPEEILVQLEKMTG